MAKPAYRVPYDLKVTGEYRFITPTGSHKLRLVGHEAQSSTSQMLYQGMDNDDAEVKAVIVNNSAIKRMADGKTVTAISSKGLKGKLKRLKDAFKSGGSVDNNWVKDGDDFIHESGYTVALHLDKDEEDYDGSTYDERQYVVLDNDGFDVAGEYMPLKQAKQTVLDALEDEDEDDYKTGGKIETKAQNKFIKVMREFGKGTLPHGKTGKIVTDRNVALAIAFSEARDIDPYFQKKKNTIYKFKNKHGGISTVKVTRNVSGKNIVNATEKGKKDSKTGFAKIYKTINSIQTEDETKDMEATINALKPIIRYF